MWICLVDILRINFEEALPRSYSVTVYSRIKFDRI